MRALVIGADGFAGRWLTKHLVESGDEVVAGVGPHFSGPDPESARVVPVDVTDAAMVDSAIRAARPEVTYYLAGISGRGKREALASAIAVTVIGSAHVLTSLADNTTGSRLLFVSSSFVYRSSPEPQDEEQVPAPSEAYGAAKLAAEGALRPLAQAGGVGLAVVRPFNHIGPGQKPGFLVPTVASQLNELAAGARSQLTVGAVDDVRDFSDVRDVVRAYRLIATSPEGGTWNVASGVGVVIGDLIDRMIGLAGIPAQVVANPPARPSGPRALVGDASRLRAMGWQPTHALDDTLREVLDEHGLPGSVASSMANS